ncbi:LacI family transcriptional regulator [Mycobacterium sp. 21AC1]|uniref:LacI family DNA-binding transcriptional regulator n=1 Tax=[Mycobacterium] appelbergii TaxID=2939269 RepID=UPI002938E233|nr:LacI family DNA-binding transcriptional regulator [Mycobacterium sp. 21AC1]MDV3127236.1 LacI family transcriptional regulator [Mycobacterium sp. 21AC1]
MTPHRPVVAKDVAEAAGVSIATVSRVLNGKPGRISVETRERVIAAAERLQYKPDPLGRSLRSGSSRTLGLVVPDIGDQYFQYIARGAETAARERGYGIVFCNTDRDPDRELAALEFLSDKRVDGVVLCGGGLQDEKHLADFDNLTIISIGPHQLPVPNLAVDNHSAMHAAISHLATLGRTRVLCIAGEREWLITQARLEAANDAAHSLGMDTDPDLVRYTGFTAEAGAAAANAALAEKLDFDAVLAFNDYAAVGAMSVLAGSGRAIPGDVAIVGCDDTDIAAYARVPLTTIRFPTARLGETAVRVLCDGDPVPATPFAYELVIRESTIGPATRAATHDLSESI